ncbi:Protein saf4 [Coemansia nantahalensis]|uniref:Protein saf4 n=1 Tax=Coemansia nantahalensis TaxID=2789366 RepID=A0ACC1K289_9FUNG|nr:Protein saf4 [Coemansia nantahalensis]
MAERRAVNKYYPPDWDPDRGSANAHVGQHPLRARARKLDEGILVVRFELPFGVWCGGCGALLAAGVRFNAEKKQIGSYHSTPIWSFRMKCRECPGWLEIHTNPKDAAYDVVRGARRKAEPEPDDAIIDLVAADSRGSRLHELDAREARNRRDAQTAQRLGALRGASDRQWRDPDAANAGLRREFRAGRRVRDEDRRQSEEIQSRTGIALPILPASAADAAAASRVRFGPADGTPARKAVAQAVAGAPLFAPRAAGSSAAPATRMALRQRGRADPFASQTIGQFGSARDVGVRPQDAVREDPTFRLAGLTSMYGQQSSEDSS